MKNKRKKKTVRFVPLTRKEPLSQRTVLELLSCSESTQLVKTSTPARVEVETSAKNCLQPGLLFCWRRSLWQIKRQQFQRHCRLKSRIPLKYPVRSLRIHQCLWTLVARLSGVEEKIMKEIRSGSSENGCGRG